MPLESSTHLTDPPPHHLPDGTFVKPWLPPEKDRHGSFPFLRWRLQRMRDGVAPDPSPDELPSGTPRLAPEEAPSDEVRATFIGHATFLLQLGGKNVLTDPIFSPRASPIPWFGPTRFGGPGLRLEELPPIDAVVLSHDHYDHLDLPTVRALHARFGEAIEWVAPLRFGAWLEQEGIRRVTELDWWDSREVAGGLRVTAAPAQHWCRRGRRVNERLWASFRIEAEVDGGPSVYFGGDSGYWPGFREIGERLGRHDLVLLPIGAYEPRWFMRLSHMNPEEAVQSYQDLGGRGVCVGMHWGSFRLTDEPPLEPPVRMREAWRAAGLPEERLALPGNGGTVVVRAGVERAG